MEVSGQFHALLPLSHPESIIVSIWGGPNNLFGGFNLFGVEISCSLLGFEPPDRLALSLSLYRLTSASESRPFVIPGLSSWTPAQLRRHRNPYVKMRLYPTVMYSPLSFVSKQRSSIPLQMQFRSPAAWIGEPAVREPQGMGRHPL